jgi:putative Ca2+/H+ antiporter (TMEM165/GDT1 family)
MAALLFTLLAVLIVGLGARDQRLLAGLAERQGARPALLLIALAGALATVGVAVWTAQVIAAAMPAPARLLFAAIALALAGLEMLVWRSRPAPIEPTNSLGAFAVVILAQQLTDATRFVIVAMAVATRAPVPVALGGSAGAVALAVIGWLASEWLDRPALVRARRVLGALVLALAAGLAWRVFA